MSLIPEEQKQRVKAELNEKLTNKVKLIMFTQEIECPFCKETRELIQEVGGLFDKIEVAIYDFVTDKEQATLYRVDKVPAVVVLGGKKTTEFATTDCLLAMNFKLSSRI